MIDLKGELSALEKMRGKYHQIFPSYITHIRFPRYKNIAPGSRIDFDFPITALVGANGSGKTSVLNALYGAPLGYSTGEYWFSTLVDPIVEGKGSPNRFIYGHYNGKIKSVVETRKARVRKTRGGKEDPNYWEPTKEAPGDGMVVPPLKKVQEGRSKDRWNPVARNVVYINFRRELSAFDKYFYFGKDPTPTGSPKSGGAKRIVSKKDLIRRDSEWLAKVLELEDTSLEHYRREIASENRLLTDTELNSVSDILGRKYEEARLVRHRLFRGEDGLSIRFKTEFGQYSEAFAGSGEVAVVSCVIQVLAATTATLLLLDEPEVSLHPGAQERLLAFLARSAKQKKLQVVFSTHSPHLIGSLPDDAIKTFLQLGDGSFSILPSTHPYAAFRRLGAIHSGEIRIIVEDRLAKFVVQQALTLISDEATRQLFHIDFVSGGATSILNKRIPVFMEGPEHILVLLDGDQRKSDQIQPPTAIPETKNGSLGAIILAQVGASPEFNLDGGANGGNESQKVASQRRYLAWTHKYLRYVPTSCPEELILAAAHLRLADQEGNAPKCKARLQAIATEALGREATSEDTDRYGEFLLATNRSKSKELEQVATLLMEHLSAVRSNDAPA